MTDAKAKTVVGIKKESKEEKSPQTSKVAPTHRYLKSEYIKQKKDDKDKVGDLCYVLDLLPLSSEIDPRYYIVVEPAFLDGADNIIEQLQNQLNSSNSLLSKVLSDLGHIDKSQIAPLWNFFDMLIKTLKFVSTQYAIKELEQKIEKINKLLSSVRGKIELTYPDIGKNSTDTNDESKELTPDERSKILLSYLDQLKLTYADDKVKNSTNTNNSSESASHAHESATKTMTRA